MLVLTENATSVIRSITDRAELSGEPGLRIATDPPGSGILSLSPSSAPAEDDRVLEKAGARVFLDQEAATTLDDKVLDAQVNDQGTVEFLLAEQRP